MVYKVEDIDLAQQLFLNVLQFLHDKYCPIKKCGRKQKYNNDL